MFGDFQAAFAHQGFVGNEEIGAPLFLEGIVFSGHLSRFGWFGRILVFDQILAHFIHADPRDCRVTRLAIDIQHIFHMIDKVSDCHLGEAPRVLEPGLEFFFSSVVRTVSGLMCST